MTRLSMKDMDAPLRAACEAAGGRRKLARALGLHTTGMNWRTTPKHHLFAVAKLSGIDAEVLRPDLKDYIDAEGRRRWMAKARDRFSLARAAVPVAPGPQGALDAASVDILISLVAAKLTSEETGIPLAKIFVGQTREAMTARTRAMGLALVAGRAAASTIGRFYGVTRQAVDNAGERWIRARDGDHPEDLLDPAEYGPGKVEERGRVRPAKTGDAGLQAAEARFRAAIEGEAA